MVIDMCKVKPQFVFLRKHNGALLNMKPAPGVLMWWGILPVCGCFVVLGWGNMKHGVSGQPAYESRDP